MSTTARLYQSNNSLCIWLDWHCLTQKQLQMLQVVTHTQSQLDCKRLALVLLPLRASVLNIRVAAHWQGLQVCCMLCCTPEG